MDQFIEQLKKRNVFRAGVAYAVVAWIVLQVAAVTFPPLGFPGWAMTLVVVLSIIGFPVTLALSWLYEWTPDGFQRHEKAVAAGHAKQQRFGRLFDFVIISLLVVAVGFLGYKRSQLEDLILISPDAPSIAVLPFKAVGNGSNRVYFADGLSEEMLNRFAAVPGLKVTARTSSFLVRDRELTPQEIAEQLGVETVLDGTVERFAGNLKISAQLVSTKNGAVIWTNSMEGPLGSVFEMQKQIFEGALGLLLPDQEPPLFEAPEENSYRLMATAYDNYLQGLYHYNQMISPAAGEEIEQMITIAEDYFQQTTNLAPSFALGWAMLAEVKRFKVAVQIVSPALEVPVITEAIEKALELGPDLAEVQYVAFRVYRWEEPERAFQHLQNALDLNPNLATAYRFLAELYYEQEEYAEYIEATEKAFALDPLNPFNSDRVIEARFYLGDDEGVAQAVAINQETQWDEGVLTGQLFFASQKGEFEKLPEFERQAAALGDYRHRWAVNALRRFVNFYMTLGLRDQAESWSEGQFDDVFLQMEGRHDEAITFLEDLVAKRATLSPGWAFRGRADKVHSLIYAYLYAGRYQNLIKLINTYEPTRPDQFFAPVAEGSNPLWADIPYVYALMQTGETEKAESWLAPMAAEMDALVEVGFDFPYFHYELAQVRMLQNRPEEAMVALETAIAQGWRRWYIWLDPVLAPLQEHPRFEALKATYDADIERMRAEVLTGLAENQAAVE